VLGILGAFVLQGCGGDTAETVGAPAPDAAIRTASIGAAPTTTPAEAATPSVMRVPLPNNSTFPIASAVLVRPETTLVYHSGLTPTPKDPDAPFRSRAYWGDTGEQALSVFMQMKDTLASMGLGLSDVIKMTVFIVGDPELDGRMDFDGFMQAYTQFFGTQSQPSLPARSAVQVMALANEGMLVEIEVVLARTR
jgi:enamine deaminase RidA (YjgF/YER057c/UK114 family)